MNKEVQWSLSFRYLMGIIFFIALVAFLFYAHDAVRNMAIAAFIAYLINPAVVYLSTSTRMSRTAAVNVMFFTSLILLVGVPATLTPIFYEEAQSVIKDLLDLSNQLSGILSEPVQFGGFVFHLEAWGQNLAHVQGAFLTPLPEEALQLLETTSVGLLWSLIILVSVYMLLSEWQGMRDRMFDFVLPESRWEMEELYRRICRVWTAYLRGQIVLMIIVGVVFTIVWLIMGIPGALVLGVLAGLFTLVPDVGPFIAVVFAAGVALLEGSQWGPLDDLPNFLVAGILVAAYLVLINLKNFFLRPIIMGRSVHMNEGLVFIVIIIATILEGILGALLVVPVLASVVIIAGYIQRKVLGLPAFEDDGSLQFVAPPEKIHPPHRVIRRRSKEAVEEPIPASGEASPEPASVSSAASIPKTNPARKKNNK
jgi:predicted PurR-regulated permease PerM